MDLECKKERYCGNKKCMELCTDELTEKEPLHQSLNITRTCMCGKISFKN